MKNQKVSKINKNLRYFLWTLVGILVLSISVLAVNTFSNSPSAYMTAGNFTLNETGIYSQGGDGVYEKSFSKTADVVVCRGTSAIDDIVKSFQCDVVCKSTDTTCSEIINSSIYDLHLEGGGLISIGCGFYNLTTYIKPRSNVVIKGHGSCTNLNLHKDIAFYYNGEEDNLENFEISNLRFSQTIVGNGVAISIKENSKNLHIHDIDFGNIDYVSYRVYTSNGTLYEHYNTIIERTISNGNRIVLGSINKLVFKDNILNETRVGLSVLADIGYSEENNGIKDATIESNTFIVTYSSSPCLGLSGYGKNYRIINNDFYCNSTAIWLPSVNENSLYTLNIIGNTFNGDSTFPTGSSFIDIVGGHPNSSAVISSNTFNGNGANYGGIATNIQSIISNNVFQNMGRKGVVLSKGQSLIDSNIFKDLSQDNWNWRWIDIQAGSNYSVLSNNHFIATSPNTYTILRFGGSNITSKGNSFSGFTGSGLYYFESGASSNSSYLESYVYPGPLSDVECSISNPTFEKSIHNSTTQATCIGGTWKYLVYT